MALWGVVSCAHLGWCTLLRLLPQVTLDWLRRCVRETPSLRMQVLVTGSLYLVGDMLKLLGKSC
jgi:hypothetical protein